MVGCNEDAWRLTPHIWFENAISTETYGAAFTGSRYDGANGYAPQSGMNEFGLSFSRLASHAPQKKDLGLEKRKKVINPTQYLKDILHNCKTVEEVKEYIGQYNHSYFIEDVFIYVDQSGKYLIVEPYTLKIGNEPTYVLSNFCPSETSQEDAMQLARYKNGVEFLKDKVDTSLQFCTALSDTMHVCRDKIGDGTLLSSIWDLKNGNVNLYFYHQYEKTVQFNLSEELKKGDHIISITSLFPTNLEFEKLRKYQIPQNNDFIRLFLILCAFLFLISSIFFGIRYFNNKKPTSFAFIQLMLVPVGIILFYYMYILSTNIYIFYFPSPYVDRHNILISLTSYIPYVLAIGIMPLYILSYQIIKKKSWNRWETLFLILNNTLYTILLGFFYYWGFFALIH